MIFYLSQFLLHRALSSAASCLFPLIDDVRPSPKKKTQLFLGTAQSLIVFWLPLSCSPEEGNGKSRLLRQQLLFHTKARVPQNWKEKGQQPPCKLKACLASFPRRC